MRIFQLFRAADIFMKRLAAVEDAMEDLRRLVRNQDLDVSDALEKIQRLSARLAKRADRLEGSTPLPPQGDRAPDGQLDPTSARILAQRRARWPKLPTED